MKEKITELFPPILSGLMLSRLEAELTRKSDRQWILLSFCVWSQTPEGSPFWSDIEDLYRKGNIPTNEQILSVFTKHNVKPESK